MLELLYHRAIHSVKSIYLRNINLSLRDAWYFAAVKKLNFFRHAQLIHNEFHDEMRCDNMMMVVEDLTDLEAGFISIRNNILSTVGETITGQAERHAEATILLLELFISGTLVLCSLCNQKT